MKKKVIISLSALVLVIIAGLVIWRAADGKKKAAGTDAALYADSVGMITGTGLGIQNRFAGVAEAQNTLKINLESGQTVKEILVEKGQAVEVGTPLFQYDTEDMSLKLEQAELELEKISNGIETTNAQIAALTKEKKQAPASEQLSYTTQIQEAQMNVKQQEYDYKVKELEIGRLKKSLESSQVNSTIGGIVQEINETPSYDNYTGEQQPFMSILAVGKYRIKGTISEQNMQNLYVGMPVIVHSRVDESLVWAGTVESIDTEKPITGTGGVVYESAGGDSMQATKYPFYVTLESSDGLMLGQHVYLEADMGQDSKKEGMWLMASYILDADGEEPYVWAAGPEDKLEKREVVLGEYDGEMDTYEILDGLKAADYIVWPSDDCRKGITVYKNEGGMMPSAGDGSGMNGEEIPADVIPEGELLDPKIEIPEEIQEENSRGETGGTP